MVGDHIDADESIFEAAQRELAEETGFSATGMKVLMECPSSAGLTDEVISFVMASGLERIGPGGGDDSEDIEVHLVPLAEVDAWLNRKLVSGIPLDPKIYAALYWLRTIQSKETTT